MYIDSYSEARKVFLKELTGTLVTVAKDVKFQIEFNPLKVAKYRLLGYENRVLEDEDFADDTKDAGELGAGQMVTAFYEIVPIREDGIDDSTSIVETRYQKPAMTEMASSEEMMFLKIRYKLPNDQTSILIEEPVTPRFKSESELSESFRFGSSVVEFALILRDSKYKGSANLNRVQEQVKSAFAFDPEGYRRSFLSMVEMTEEMFDIASK
jgi:Ca-activated chloride channel family protein